MSNIYGHYNGIILCNMHISAVICDTTMNKYAVHVHIIYKSIPLFMTACRHSMSAYSMKDVQTKGH